MGRVIAAALVVSVAGLGTAFLSGAVRWHSFPRVSRLSLWPAGSVTAPTASHAVPATEPAVGGSELSLVTEHSVVIARHGCAGLKPESDVLIHFHGAISTVEPRLLRSGIDAVYVVANLGEGSGPYEDAFAAPGTLSAYLDDARSHLAAHCGGLPRSFARVGLSAWSAGYGAVFRIIARPEDAARVDAVLLADGLHVGFDNSYRRVSALAMQPFTHFAERAALGDKLMAITHTAISTPTYASTSETARFLVDTLHVDRQVLDEPGPLAAMRHVEHAARGNLIVDGYSGADAKAHADQLYSIDATLWPQLNRYWQRATALAPARSDPQ